MARKSRKNVGLIGLGIIGARIAAGLRAAGYHVFVWNRTPKPAPNFVGSPAEVAEICDIIQIFVADAQAVREVVESFGDQLGPKHIIVNCATIGPEATVDIAQLVQARGAAFLDAPFTGSKGAAEKSQLVYYVGGEEEIFHKAKPVLEATSRAIVRCGGIGDASILKVATNLITAVTTQTLAEALAIVQGAGISPDAFAAALEHNACKSGVVELKLPKMVSGDYEPHFSVKHMFKDVQIGIHMANQQRLEVPLTTVVGGVLYGALCNGWGDLDFASLYRVYSDEAARQQEAPIALPEQSAEQALAGGERGGGNESDVDAAAREEAAPTEKPAAQTPEAGAAPEGAGEDQAAKHESVSASEAAEPVKLDESGNVEVKLDAEVAAASEGALPAAQEKISAETKGEPGAGHDGSPESSKSAEQKADAAGDEAGTPASAEAEAAKVDGADKGKSEGEAAGNGSSAGGDADEENGLSAFFSRVFRRKGTPVEK